MDIPITLVIFQLKARIEKKTGMSREERLVMEQTSHTSQTSGNTNQGKGNLFNGFFSE